MNTENMLISDGYVGSMGITWNTPTQDDLEKAITGAMNIEEKSRDEIIAILESGKPVRWCKSANYAYDHSYGMVGTKRAPKKVEMVMCDCGHEVERSLVMRGNLGTCCPDCYDSEG
jgi:type IV secretory pathway VirB6-like protein